MAKTRHLNFHHCYQNNGRNHRSGLRYPYVDSEPDYRTRGDVARWRCVESDLQFTFASEIASLAMEHFQRYITPIWEALADAGVSRDGMRAALQPLLHEIGRRAEHEAARRAAYEFDDPRLRYRARDIIERNYNWDLGRELRPQAPRFTEAAQEKAKDTLRACLNAEQLAEFNANGYFHVQVENKGKFKVTNTLSYSVHDTQNGDRYCVQTPDVPIHDQMLSLKLLLESDPKTFFKTANKSAGQTATAQRFGPITRNNPFGGYL